MTAEERFSFTPAVAPFIMAFADLNRYILRVPKPTTPMEEIINIHMYLTDLKTLDFDVPSKFTEKNCTRMPALRAKIDAVVPRGWTAEVIR